MKRLFALSVAALLFGCVGIGCQNTAEGVKQDAAPDTAAVKDAGDKAAVATATAAKKTEMAAKDSVAATAEATKAAADHVASATEKATDRMASATEKAGKNASDALTLTPKVKLAITNDAELNNTSNLINVDSANNVVELKGYVLTKEMKVRAEKIAKEAIKAAGSDDRVKDSLTVKGK